jgi:hypothetical protein
LEEHRGKDGYWKEYRLAQTHERDELISDIVTLVRKNEPPRRKEDRRGKEKGTLLAEACRDLLLMMIQGHSFRELLSKVPFLNLP